MKANDHQVGGTHYQRSAVQHWDAVSAAWGPGYLLGCASKYVTRWRHKDGPQALEKANHYLQKHLEVFGTGEFPTMTYSEENTVESFLDDPAHHPEDGEILHAIFSGDIPWASELIATLLMREESSGGATSAYVNQG